MTRGSCSRGRARSRRLWGQPNWPACSRSCPGPRRRQPAVRSTRTPTRPCEPRSKGRSKPSRCRCSCPRGSTTTGSSTRATPAQSSACACRSSTGRRFAAQPGTASSGCERDVQLANRSAHPHASWVRHRCSYSDTNSAPMRSSECRFGRMGAVLTRVLVANRGEIARRVFKTCRERGLSTVAVASDADAAALHVAEADCAVRLPGESAADTYLRGDLLIDAALRAGADAVHPGYGFLSENASFARAVQGAGLTWIGPPPDAIEAMGSKIESKRLMAEAGVPVLGELDPETLTDADLPVLIKASAGGGGRGMRVVRALEQLPAELEAASSEAQFAFGDPTVFCEPYVEQGRHIEVQILADDAGTVWAVGERECSIQRRHQKIIEEAPSPLVQRLPEMREQLFAAARAAATAVGYRNAGTVEFLADESGRFYFLEMNTRLQVEHPVTECTAGYDLVALQLQIAAGRLLGPEPVRPYGHAIEVRLYAEDPAAGWQPQAGTLHRFDVPGQAAAFRPVGGARGPDDAAMPVLRLDSGVTDGSAVGIFYDPMLAKVICWAPEREQ